MEQLQRDITLQKILLLEKTVFSVRQKGVLPLLLPASMLQLPRCLTRICNLFQKEQLIANWQVSKSAIAAGKTDYKIQFAPQMWATRPHLGSIFKKLLHRKTFYSPAARCLQSCDFGAMFHVKHSQDAHSTSFEKTVETSMIHDAYIDTVFHRKNS